VSGFTALSSFVEIVVSTKINSLFPVQSPSNTSNIIHTLS